MTERDDIRAKLVAFYVDETANAAPELTDATDLREGLGLDSVDLVGIVLRVENHYRIRLTHPDLVALTSVGSLVDLVQAKLAEPVTLTLAPPTSQARAA